MMDTPDEPNGLEPTLSDGRDPPFSLEAAIKQTYIRLDRLDVAKGPGGRPCREGIRSAEFAYASARWLSAIGLRLSIAHVRSRRSQPDFLATSDDFERPSHVGFQQDICPIRKRKI